MQFSHQFCNHFAIVLDILLPRRHGSYHRAILPSHHRTIRSGYADASHRMVTPAERTARFTGSATFRALRDFALRPNQPPNPNRRTLNSKLPVGAVRAGGRAAWRGGESAQVAGSGAGFHFIPVLCSGPCFTSCFIACFAKFQDDHHSFFFNLLLLFDKFVVCYLLVLLLWLNLRACTGVGWSVFATGFDRV